MSATRKRIAQMCATVAGAAMFLPWNINAGLSGTQTVRGISTGIGRILFVVCLLTIVLVQIRWRPAWIGAGFAGAIAAREAFDPSGIGPLGRPPDPGIGIWTALIAAGIAAVLLVWDMLVDISGTGDDEDPPRRGLSGPLGRRR